MVTILIKSFNRPHYLDRCLISIQKNVSGKFHIKIIDDGTPEKYLELIQKKHSGIEIIQTERYTEKSLQIQNQDKVSGIIPSRDWYEAVENSAEYVLVIEDDVWFTDPININELSDEMENMQIFLLKLGWNSMPLNSQQLEKIHDSFLRRKVNLFSLNSTIIDWLFADKFRVYTILKKLKMISPSEFYKYYLFISISSGIHRKEYWLKTWENLDSSVNEKQQIKNAINFYKKNKTLNFIAHYKKELIKTTYKSSATNSFHEYGFQFDVFKFNQILNEAWFDDKLDPMENYPKDFSDEYIQSFLEKANHPDAQYSEWKKWADKFKEQYRNLGAEIE